MIQRQNNYTVRWILVIVTAIAFTLLTWMVCRGMTDTADDKISLAVASARTPGLTTLFTAVTYLGSWEAIVIVCLLSLVYWKTGESHALAISITAIITTLFRIMLKGIIARPRPTIVSHLVDEGGFSYPSGHAIASMSVYMLVFILLYKIMEQGARKNALLTLCAALPFLIGFSRVYLGVHYASDVLGGWLAGVAFGLAILTAAHLTEQYVKNRKEENENHTKHSRHY